MAQSIERQSELTQLFKRAGAGDDAALDALIRHNADRLTSLTHRMLSGFPGVKRWADTGDVLQNSLVRLLAALRDVKPQSSREFLALAALQVRRELIDLARHFHGPQGMGANHDSLATDAAGGRSPRDKIDHSHEPSSLSQWTELHQYIDTLPDNEREVVGLLFYQGMPQADAAEILQISVRTLQRRWHDVLVKLHSVWNVEGPR